MAYTQKGIYYNTEYSSVADILKDEKLMAESTDEALGEVDNIETQLEEIERKIEDGDFDGKDGITPTIGANGNWYLGEEDTGKPSRGEQGNPGQNGVNGITPTIGQNGNWYIGDTDTGKPSRGEQGTSGSPGQPGANGITPTIGNNGNWYLGETDTGKPSRGENGTNRN